MMSASATQGGHN